MIKRMVFGLMVFIANAGNGAGTAACQKQFDVHIDWLKGGDRVFLDLGRVRNVAEVTLKETDVVRGALPFPSRAYKRTR